MDGQRFPQSVFRLQHGSCDLQQSTMAGLVQKLIMHTKECPGLLRCGSKNGKIDEPIKMKHCLSIGSFYEILGYNTLLGIKNEPSSISDKTALT